MRSEVDIKFWRRFRKASGFAGGLAFLLIWWASMIGGFDVRVFGLGLIAIMVVWARNWALVPFHLRFERESDAQFQRYLDSNLPLVDVLTDLSGSEIEELKDKVLSSDNAYVAAFFKRHRPSWDVAARVRFLSYFRDDWVNADWLLIENDGKITDIDK